MATCPALRRWHDDAGLQGNQDRQIKIVISNGPLFHWPCQLLPVGGDDLLETTEGFGRLPGRGDQLSELAEFGWAEQ